MTHDRVEGSWLSVDIPHVSNSSVVFESVQFTLSEHIYYRWFDLTHWFTTDIAQSLTKLTQ